MTKTRFTVGVYQRRVTTGYEWTTLGLGEANQSVTAKSHVKLQRNLTKELAKVVAKLPAGELDRFQMAPGSLLRRVHVDTGLRLASGKQRLTGLLPLICSPRFLDGERKVLVVTHPLQQDDWFFCDDGHDLAGLAARFFRHAWTRLAAHQLRDLLSSGYDQLRSISFSADVPTLSERVAKKSDRSRKKRQPQAVLSRIGIDQTVRAIEKTLPLGMARPAIRGHLGLLLSGANRQSVLVVGEPGSGKSTVINRWVADDLETSGFAIDRDLEAIDHVWRVSGKRIIAGMSYVGDWEQRCLDLLFECTKKRAILWVEDIHLFGRLGQSRESLRNLADFFRGPVSRGELTIVGECTDSQRQRLEDDAPSFASLFRPIRLSPTTDSETMAMMISEARALEQRLAIRFNAYIFQTILELGAGLYPWTAFPGKALELLRRLAASAVPRGDEIVPSDLIRLLSADTGLPENLLTLSKPIDMADLNESISNAIIGQPDAVEVACDLVARVRSGLCPAGRPLAVYLFTGPTGTGKTELAKVIARYLYGGASRLLRFDMSEYGTADAPARLIGDAFEPSGQLTRRIREQPFSVLLLDEIEKAHRSVLYLLLQLFDEGRLTDAAGNTASFANAVIIMTSNLGAKPTRPIGFGSETRGMMADISRAVRDFFPPELFNRIDHVVPFRPLSPEAAERIATKEMAELFTRRGLTERNIFVYASEAVKSRIVEQAFDPRLGARTVKRYLEHEIGGLLVDEIASGRTARMRVLRVFEGDDAALSLHAEVLAEAEPEEAQFGLAELFDVVPKRLIPAAEKAAALLRENLSTLTIDRAWRELSGSDHASELRFFVDQLKDRVDSLRTQLLAGESGAAGRAQRIRAIAEARHLVRNIADLGYREAHAVWIELTAMGQGGNTADHAGHADGEATGAGPLLSWLASAYGAAFDGWLDGFATLNTRGKVRYGTDSAGLEDALWAGHLSRAVLSLSGLFAVDAFAGERGTHIWQPSSAEPAIVRVDITSAAAGDHDAKNRLEKGSAAISAFEAALASGSVPLPPNPRGLVAAVRSLRYSPSLRPGEVFPMAIEDFRTQTSVQLNVSDVRTAIVAMIDNWCGREIGETS